MRLCDDGSAVMAERRPRPDVAGLESTLAQPLSGRPDCRVDGFYWVLLSHGRARFGERWGGRARLDIAHWSDVGWEIIGWEDGCLDEDIEVVSGPLIPPI